MEVKTAGNESSFQKQALQATSVGSGIRAVPLDTSEGTLGLDGAVHAQQGAVDAVEVVENFLVEAGKLLIEADGAVALSFGAFILVWTARAIFALIKFLRSTVEVAPDRYSG